MDSRFLLHAVNFLWTTEEAEFDSMHWQKSFLTESKPPQMMYPVDSGNYSEAEELYLSTPTHLLYVVTN
jgi:hypothetical protein